MPTVPAWHGLNPAGLLKPRAATRPPFPFSAPESTAFHRARYAIYHLFRALGLEGKTVLVPDYHQGSEVCAMRAAGAAVRFYRIDRRLQPDLNEVTHLCRSGARALYVIHFLGWPQPIEDLAAVCQEHGIPLIEDCALSLLSETRQQPLGTFGDYAVFCLYKTLPLPGGGILVQNRRVLNELAALDLKPHPMLASGRRALGLTLEWVHGRAPGRVGSRDARHPAQGDVEFDPRRSKVGMSALSRALLRRLDLEDIRRRRRANFALLQERLEGRVAAVHTDLGDACPLLFPVLVPDKPAAIEVMRRQGIRALDWWNDAPAGAGACETTDVRFLRDHLLGLPVHQDLTTGQVEFMAERVSGLDSRIRMM